MKKQCSRCKTVLPATADHFVATKNLRGERIWTPECKPCRRAMCRSYYYRNQEKMVARAVERIARLRREDPSYREYDRKCSRNCKRRQLADPIERAKHNARGREWVRANPERAKLFKHRQKPYRVMRSAKRRALMLGATGEHFKVRDIERHLEAQGRCCFWCHVPLSGKRYHVDHMIPLSRGGDNGCANIVIACAQCNQSKGSKLPEEFLAARAAA